MHAIRSLATSIFAAVI